MSGGLTTLFGVRGTVAAPVVVLLPVIARHGVVPGCGAALTERDGRVTPTTVTRAGAPRRRRSIESERMPRPIRVTLPADLDDRLRAFADRYNVAAGVIARAAIAAGQHFRAPAPASPHRYGKVTAAVRCMRRHLAQERSQRQRRWLRRVQRRRP